MKPMVRYQMNFSGKCQAWSAFFAGLAFFLIVVYYYVLGNYETVQGADAFWNIYAPMAILGLYMILSRLVKVDVLLVFAGVALLYFINLSVINFQTDAPTWLDVTETVIYGLCVIALVFSGLGYIPGKWCVAFVLFLCVAGRVWFRDFLHYLVPMEPEAAMPDLSWLCGVLSMSCMCFALKPKPVRIRKRNAERV